MEVALWYVSSTPSNTYQCNTYHLSFPDWFAAKKIGSPPEVIVNPYFSGNLWRCLSFVKCSLNQTKCQSTSYHMGEASTRRALHSVERQVVPLSGHYQETGALSPSLMHHGLRHSASWRLSYVVNVAYVSHGCSITVLNSWTVLK